MKRVIMIIAPINFRDEELLIPKRILEENKIKVDIASTKKGTCEGMLGTKVEVTKTLKEINVDEYDAIMLVGGSGTPLIRREDRVIEIIKEAYVKGKIVSAICWAPTTLAKAGILNGKKATVWLGMDQEYGKTTDKVLESYGATYVQNPVVDEGNIITANGPRVAEAYGTLIVKKLEN